MKRRPFPHLVLLLVSLVLVLVLGDVLAAAQAPQPADTVEPPPTAAATGETEGPTPTEASILEGVVATRTPEPTVTPGRIAVEVSEFTTSLGLTNERYLGLTADDWINLGISILSILFAFLVGTWVIRHALPRVVRRTPSDFDDRFLQAIGPQLRWLVVLVVVQFATQRLTFVSAEAKSFLSDVYFVLAVFLGWRVVGKLVSLADQWHRERAKSAGREDELAPIITLLTRLANVVVAVVGIAILLSHFGINITAFAAALGLGGLAISLAAKDTIADAIAGFIILVDRPFRIGDRIEIEDAGTWGDVVSIGLRTTRIRTRDNRLVIVPNSIIGSNQVINYTYPDPRYRIETHVAIAYGTDVKTAQRVIIDAVRQVEGVLADKPVDALYIEMGDWAMLFRVRWWIESYEDTRRMFDRVHTALQHALDEAGIESPYPTQDLKVRVRPEEADHLRESFGDG